MRIDAFVFWCLYLTLAADLSVKGQASPPAHLRLLPSLAGVQELLHSLGGETLEVVVVNLSSTAHTKTKAAAAIGQAKAQSGWVKPRAPRREPMLSCSANNTLHSCCSKLQREYYSIKHSCAANRNQQRHFKA